MVAPPLGLDAEQLAEVPGVQAAAHGLGLEARQPRGALRRDEAGHERHHADPAVAGQPGQHVVGYIARAVGDRLGAGVREDHRGLGHIQRIVHRGNRNMRQVYQHAEPLHLADHVPPELGQPAGLRLVGGRVGPAGVGVVGQRQVPDAERVEHPQHAERTGDGVAAFGAEQRGHPAGGEHPLHVVRGQREAERLGVARDQPPGHVDLLEHGGDRAIPVSTGSGQPGRDVDGPELRPDPAGRRAGAGRCAGPRPARRGRSAPWSRLPGRARARPRAGRCARRSAGSAGAGPAPAG